MNRCKFCLARVGGHRSTPEGRYLRVSSRYERGSGIAIKDAVAITMPDKLTLGPPDAEAN